MIARGMRWLRRLALRVFGRQDEPPPDPEAVRALFQRRYHALRVLLAANTKALESMAAMERAAAGVSPLSMSFVRSHCTAAVVSTFKMAQNLEVLAPSRYTTLFDRLHDIQRRIDNELAGHPRPADVPLILPMAEVDGRSTDITGAKMANLGEVANVVGLPVPRGFVITAAAYDRLITTNDLQPEIDRLLLAHQTERIDEMFALSSDLQNIILSARVPDEVATAVASAAAALAEEGAGTTFALRSSALGEDTANASFAGQYQSLLNVRRSHLALSYLEVVASKYTPQAMHYRLRRGLRDQDIAMSVGCLEMVDARSGGVAYTGNPGQRDDRNVYISSNWGLPKAIVDGRFASDLLVIGRDEPRDVLERAIGDKTHQFVLHRREGVQRAEVPLDLQRSPSLTDEEAVAVAELALRLDQHFETAVDIEWAIKGNGEIVVLQCRPLIQSAMGDHRFLPADAPLPLIEGGVTASPGAAAGPVHRVRRDSDVLAFPDGAVLVVEQPLPRWAALLGSSAAVVAECGGVAGHLATVARELCIPALFGAGEVESLQEGTEVTVDASGERVYPGRIEALLEVARVEQPVIESPVRETLRSALRLIAPLNLLDPDGLDFKPTNCQTLHDITRFCHEQAVREIFAFGTETRFPEYASKQLYHNVPMQWWILDLGGGIKQAAVGKYVRLEDIACQPMLALWDGMVAVPWEGPPAATGRGFASILFEATTNPALATPFRKPYAVRNYFIISEHFINLQSRFGFHLTNAEALASPRPAENYVSFSFKGGAADMDRRAARARFIGHLMVEIEFETRITEDFVTARRMNLAAREVEQALRAVGYLLMHTRQLDMIMDDQQAIENYRAKMSSEIASLGRDS
jgi:pyruvate,water dikinase